MSAISRSLSKPPVIKITEPAPPGTSVPWPRPVADLAIPLPGPGRLRVAVLTVPVPMVDAEWDSLVRVLTAMKPGLVLP